jgi:hypothetical protein
MTANQSLRLYQLFLKHFNNDANAKAFVDELEIVLEEKSISDKEIYSNKNDLESFRKDVERDFQLMKQEMKTGFAETKSELKTEINKLIIWIVGTFLAGGSLMILIAKLFFEK